MQIQAPLLLYLYYAFDNRPRWFRWLWRLSNAARLLIRRLPPRPKQLVTDLIALAVYWPLSRLASLASAPPWSSASLVPRSARCARPPGWWICAFRRGRPIGVSWGKGGGRERGAALQPHWPVLSYYGLNGEGSVWVGFWSSTFKARSRS